GTTNWKVAKMSDLLYRLARPIPAKYVKDAPTGKHGRYVPHPIVEQFLIATLNDIPNFEIIEILRGPLPEYEQRDTGGTVIKTWPALPNAVHGVVASMEITIDENIRMVTECGSCDAGAYEDNDGERLKKAVSDAFKRCAMRFGVGLHLWCKSPDDYFLARALRGAARYFPTRDFTPPDDKREETDEPITGIYAEGEEPFE
ncbi:MAG: Rad52/Rad22 family DNA repair protein, partial [Acidimicrobiia bacterium]